jgi:HK97 family phage major capsid protein
MSNNRIAQSEAAIARITEDKNKSLRSLSTLTLEGKENTPAAKALQASIETAEQDISALRSIISNPSFIAIAQKEENEARTQQTDAVVQQTASAVTAAIIKSEKDERAKFNRAYRNFFRTGEARDVISSNSGAVIPQLFSDEWTATLKQISPVSQLVKNIKTDNYGRPVKNPIVQDTSNSLVYTPESTTVSQLDPSLSSTLNTPSETDTLTAFVKFSNELLSDAFDLVSFLKEIFAVRYARSLESAILIAQDGQANALPNSTTGGLISSAAVAVTTASLAAGVTYANLAALKASVDRAYSTNPDASFIVSSGLYSALEATEDSTGRPLYGYSDAGVLQVAGKDCYPSSLLANVGTANGIAALYGSFKESWISQTSDLAFKFVRERFADVNESALIGLARVAGTSSVNVTNSVKALKLASA